MAKYKLTNGETIIRTEDGASIPADPDNRDYAQYLADMEAGEEAEPADPEPKVVEPTPLERLEAAGLTVQDLKALLGIK